MFGDLDQLGFHVVLLRWYVGFAWSGSLHNLYWYMHSFLCDLYDLCRDNIVFYTCAFDWPSYVGTFGSLSLRWSATSLVLIIFVIKILILK